MFNGGVMLSGNATVPAWPGLGGSTLECSARLLVPRRLARVVALLQATSLDRELADGGDPAGCPILAARAAKLASARTRGALARELERTVLAPPAAAGALRIPRSRAAVAANRTRLFELVARLRSQDVLYARGLAMLRLLLVDGTGPLYMDRHGEALTLALEEAAARLDG
jgi:hypothetical protein